MTSKPVVLWILGVIAFLILAALFAYNISYHVWGGSNYDRITSAHADLLGIETQLNEYKKLNGFYPSTQQGLHALVARPDTAPVPLNWNQHFGEDRLDPWQHPYMYRYPSARDSNTFDLFSLGADGVESGDDVWLPQSAPPQH